MNWGWAEMPPGVGFPFPTKGPPCLVPRSLGIWASHWHWLQVDLQRSFGGMNMRALLVALLTFASAAHGAESTTAQARDINLDGVVDAYYDPAADLTWTADANLPETLGLGFEGLMSQ